MSKAFTLIELLVVISIIAILIGLSVFGLQGARQSSRDAQRKADLEKIRSALEVYRSDVGSYPSSATCGSTISQGANTYLNPVPCDPLNSGIYVYTYAVASNSYTLTAKLELGGTVTCTPLGCVIANP